MGMKDPLQIEEEMEVKFSEVEKQSKDWHDRGYKIMMVYQPITGGSIATDFYKSMLSVLSGEIWSYMADKHKIILKPYISMHFPIDANRNMAALDARDRYKADYIFFMDTDQTFPAMTIPTLYEALLEKQKENFLSVMAGMYFVKKNPWRGVFGDYGAWGEKTEKHRAKFEELGLVHEGKQLLYWNPVDFWDKGSIFQVDVIGAGCMMMPIEVFDAMEMPYFKYVPDVDTPGKQCSEDMWFCAQAKKKGIPIWMNSNVSCGHLSAYEVCEALYVNQRDTLFDRTTKDKAIHVYSKMNDRRSEAAKKEWHDKVIGPIGLGGDE